MTVAVGCDYSTKAVHLALVGPRSVLSHEVVDLRNIAPVKYLPRLREALKNIGGATYPPMPLTLFLEESWARHDTGIQTAIAIHRIAAFVEAAAYFVGYAHVERVPVPRWRSQIFGSTPRSADAKRASLAYVNQAFGITTRDDNLADSICLGAYGERTLRLAARVAG